MVEDAEPNSILATTECYIEHPWFNDAKPVGEGGTLEKDGRSVKVKAVIYRGGIADWCIYHSLDANLTPADFLDDPEHLDNSFERVMAVGEKLHSDKLIRALVECDDEVVAMYRH